MKVEPDAFDDAFAEEDGWEQGTGGGAPNDEDEGKKGERAPF
jgi:hypothetical protein